jgi:ATP-dependent DNA helicase RecQ
MAEDPITLSQKILSCVLRLEQRYGVAHTVKVLTGANDARVRELGHDRLSTYNLLAAEGATAVRTWIGQLIQQGYLRREGEYAVLAVTDSGRRLLRRDGAPKLSVPRPTSRTSSRGEKGTARAATAPRGAADSDWSGVDRQLFEVLRKLRSTLAGEMNVPAYVVFSDNTLRELARHRPVTLEQFARIKGVGERKLQDYGEAFVAAISEHSPRTLTP